METSGFIISRHWRDTPRGIELQYCLTTDDGPVRLLLEGQEAVFFIPRSDTLIADKSLQSIRGWRREPRELRDFNVEPVDAYYFSSQRGLRAAKERLTAQGLDPLEADIKPSDRFLMERFIRGSLKVIGQGDSSRGELILTNPQLASSSYQPQFTSVSIDIETAMDGLVLYSIAAYGIKNNSRIEKIFMVSTEPVEGEVMTFSSEKTLLIAFFDWLKHFDPDVIMGWNVVNFDLWFINQLCEKYAVPFSLGRGGDVPHWRLMDDEGYRRSCSVSGRFILDGIELLKAAAYRFESYSLGVVAQQVLGASKLIKGNQRGEQITELYADDKPALAAYNLQDCKLVWDIVDKLKLIEFAVARSQLTGLPLDRIGGSVASFDFRYLPLLHRQGFVAPNGHLLDEVEASPGGYVMDSMPGLYEHVLVLDFKSLYPSIIRSFNIDPLAMALGMKTDMDQKDLVPGFKGAWFSKERSLLPDIIAELWQSRDQAKADNDQPLSHAIKIIMNSFYGVLGSGGCRFFDSRLASSITRRGHQIIQQTAAFIESQHVKVAVGRSLSCKVIYGDTDSVFVWLKDAAEDSEALKAGSVLAAQLNVWWNERLKKEYGVESALEIEFETHFTKFLMPTIRGSDQGSKKRYAGVIKKNDEETLIFKGLENVRTDWTPLARELQREIYRRVFYNEPYKDYIQSVVSELRLGNLDEKLFYRKRLRRKLEEYQRNIPPHVQAARKATSAGELLRRGDWVEYAITLSGAEPRGSLVSMLDYQHYIDRQLAPAVDSILYFIDDSFGQIIDRQLSIF